MAAAVDDYLIQFNSVELLPAMLRLLRGVSRDAFWATFVRHWPTCDATWHWRGELLRLLRRHGPGLDHLDAEAGALFDALPERIAVYRGASRARVRGLSWSTSYEVAAGFARGHRGLRVPDPVIATAAVGKETVFAVFDDRGEGEVLLDPRGLRHVRVAVLGIEARP